MDEFVAYFNGEWIPRSECKVHVSDRGFALGDAVYEAERTFNGRIFDLEGHVDRLYRSLRYVRIDPAVSREQMRRICLESVERNHHMWREGNDFALRQYVTRGSGASVSEDAPPVLYSGVDYVAFGRFAGMYDTGGHVVFTRSRSYSPNSLDPKIKHLSRMNFALAELEAADVDPESWPVLLDQDGNISEGVTFNFWIVSDGVIKTARDRNILEGVTRKTVIGLAGKLGIPVVEEDIQLYDAYTADETFITATSFSVLPISMMDSRPLDGDVPGPVVKQLIAAWSEMVGVDIADQARRSG